MKPMQKNKKFQIRTGGFTFWLMGVLILVFAVIAIAGIMQLLLDFDKKEALGTLFGVLVIAYLAGYLIDFINGNRIVLDRESLAIYGVTMYDLKKKQFPNNISLRYP